MTGILPTWLLTVVLGLATVLLLVIGAALVPRRLSSLTATTACPWVGRTLTVQYLCEGSEPVCVTSCTAFADRSAVTCGMPCIGGDGSPAALLRG